MAYTRSVFYSLGGSYTSGRRNIRVGNRVQVEHAPSPTYHISSTYFTLFFRREHDVGKYNKKWFNSSKILDAVRDRKELGDVLSVRISRHLSIETSKTARRYFAPLLVVLARCPHERSACRDLSTSAQYSRLFLQKIDSNPGSSVSPADLLVIMYQVVRSTRLIFPCRSSLICFCGHLEKGKEGMSRDHRHP